MGRAKDVDDAEDGSRGWSTMQKMDRANEVDDAEDAKKMGRADGSTTQ